MMVENDDILGGFNETVPAPQEIPGNSAEKRKTIASVRKKERLEDIISAVSEKEDVISAFRGIKKTREPINADSIYSENVQKMAEYFATPWKYLLLNFWAGIFFALGFIIILGTALHFFIYTSDIKLIGNMFHKFVILMKSLGR